MSTQVQKITEMLEMLPEQEQNLAIEMLKRIVQAWDPNYTKLTPREAKELEEARNGEFFDTDEIDWEHLEKYE